MAEGSDIKETVLLQEAPIVRKKRSRSDAFSLAESVHENLTYSCSVSYLGAEINFTDSIREVLICSACQNTLQEPKILPCQHKFCLKCLEKQANENLETKTIHCYQCNANVDIPEEGVKGLPDSIEITDLITVYEVSKV